jgi:hypothetical protein
VWHLNKDIDVGVIRAATTTMVAIETGTDDVIISLLFVVNE